MLNCIGLATILFQNMQRTLLLPSKTTLLPKGAASLSGVDSSGHYSGTAEQLLADFRKTAATAPPAAKAQLTKIADRLELLVDEIKLLDDAKFAEVVARYGHGPDTTALYKDGVVYLRRSRGPKLLEDLAHEGTHSLDFSPKGIFAGQDPALMIPEDVFIREYRAYMAQKLISGKIPFGTRDELIKHILKKYNANLPSF